AFVLEVIELPHDFLAALGREQFKGFQRRTVVFAKAVAAGGLAPLVENELPRVRAPDVGVGQRFGIKIAETGQSFHKSAPKVRGGRGKEKTNPEEPRMTEPFNRGLHG